MAPVLIARQPIIDRRRNTFGYELLHRSVDGGQIVDGDAASATVVSNALLEIGLNHLVGTRRAFVNMTRNFLVDGHYQVLPAEQVVLEVLEDVEPDSDVIWALRQAREAGYEIALDDFIYAERFDSMLALADYVKIDLRAMDADRISGQVDLVRRPGLRLLAEKVETVEEYQRCFDLGFDLFQGFYFCTPTTIRRKELPANQLVLLQLLVRLQDESVRIQEVVLTIEKDVSLCYMLLRMVNSALYAPVREIESVQQAVVMLGSQTVRRCVGILLMSSNRLKPEELMVTAILRARFCELLAADLPGQEAQKYFTVGLLSVLDALTDMPMREVLKTVPLTAAVRAAILDHEGGPGQALRAVMACEQMDFDALRALEIDESNVWKTYFEAVKWATRTQKELTEVQAERV